MPILTLLPSRRVLIGSTSVVVLIRLKPGNGDAYTFEQVQTSLSVISRGIFNEKCQSYKDHHTGRTY